MITIEEIAGYLPYGLGFQIEQFEQISTIKMEGLTTDNGTVVVWGDKKSGYGKAFNKKPLLRPLSSLTTDDGFDMYLDLCEELGLAQCEHFIKALTDGTYYAMDVKQYETARKWLYKNYFDLHGLIERGDAINLLEYKTR